MNKFFLMAFAAIFAFTFSSCDKDKDKDDPTDVSIVGTWNYKSVAFDVSVVPASQNDAMKEYFTIETDEDDYVMFRANGTGTDGEDEFTYTLKNGKLTMTYPDEISTVDVVISGNTMTLKLDHTADVNANSEFKEAFGITSANYVRIILSMTRE